MLPFYWASYTVLARTNSWPPPSRVVLPDVSNSRNHYWWNLHENCTREWTKKSSLQFGGEKWKNF